MITAACSLYIIATAHLSPEQLSRQKQGHTSTALRQSRGSQVMARVLTLQPSLPVPLWSTSTSMSPGMPGSEMRLLSRKLYMPRITRICSRQSIRQQH